jgi:lipopolysaccharide transport system ATP-binding protein
VPAEPIITVENLSKRYRLGSAPRHTTLRDTLTHSARSLLNHLRPAKSRDTTRSATADSPDEFWALRDVSFSINRGDVTGIVGRNGAGKSTLLKILSRITEPTTGRITLNGRVASLLEVGTGFHGELSGRENIFLNGAILGMTRAEIRRKFDEIVAFAEIEQFLDTPVKRYSSGMYVRLAFAVAAHLEPEILIVDEVLAVGDAAFQKKCLGKMRAVAKGEGRTVLFVSHNTATVRALCQNVLWLERGKLRAAGPTAPLLNEYLQDSGDARASEVDLTVNRSPDGKKLFLRRLLINGGKPVCHGQPFSFELEFSAPRDIEDVSFGCGFSTLDGTRLYSLDSDWNSHRPRLAATASATVRCELPAVHLQPGLYSFDVGARSGPFDGIDYVPSCATVEILPGPDTPASIVRTDGGVRPPANWFGF